MNTYLAGQRKYCAGCGMCGMRCVCITGWRNAILLNIEGNADAK